MLKDDTEQMFDSESFSGLSNAEEAKAAYSYFAHNLTTFRSQLTSEGKSYEEVGETLRQCWTNLLQSCQKVGFMNGHLQRMATLYGIGSNKALPKSESK